MRKLFARTVSITIPLLFITVLGVSCNTSFDLQDQKSIGHTGSYLDRSKTNYWESNFTDKFGFDMEGFKYEGYSYRDNSIFILKTTTLKVEQRKILFLDPSGQVFELKANEVELGNGITKFQNKRFERTTWGEHGRKIY